GNLQPDLHAPSRNDHRLHDRARQRALLPTLARLSALALRDSSTTLRRMAGELGSQVERRLGLARAARTRRENGRARRTAREPSVEFCARTASRRVARPAPVL